MTFPKIISILPKEKFLSISIYDPTMQKNWQARKPTIKKTLLYVFPTIEKDI
jgi:hypothetical protein